MIMSAKIAITEIIIAFLFKITPKFVKNFFAYIIMISKGEIYV